MRSIPNTYIFSLALADLLVIVTCVPFTSVLYTVEKYPWDEVVCKLSEFVMDVSIGVSVFTLTALSVERYTAIVNPLKKFQTRPVTVLCALIIWIIAVVFALPSAIFSRIVNSPIEKENVTIPTCDPYPAYENYAKYAVVIRAVIYYILPLIIIAIFYILMAIHLHASTKEIPGESCRGQGIAQAKARKHVARMVLIFVLLFFICFLPNHVYRLWYHLNPNSGADYNAWWHYLKMIGFCLSFLNSCVNPIALYCVSSVFRAYFNHYLFCFKDPEWRRQNYSMSRGETRIDSTI
ncbi:hypothetical protein ABEB36_014123 [Hypothenemus hampei]|uniref:G-protein coupled receptors family 1 profile domain-containing protein n=1 Tax=Hypothenemus hampei TaxID=57062 RepID=A0ABD1E4A9_HYPHA